MDNEEDICDIVNTTGTCLSWENCTSTGYIANWTEQSCQPEPVKKYKDLMLTSLGETLSAFIYFSQYLFIHKSLRNCRDYWLQSQFVGAFNIYLPSLLQEQNKKKV